MLPPGPPDLPDRIAAAVEAVRNRLLRATAALETAGVPYAVVGENAVAYWVATVDESAVRNTPDVDILLRRDDFDAAAAALGAAGFFHCQDKGADLFLDRPGARARDAVRIVFAGERIRPDGPETAPDLDETEPAASFRVVPLPALMRMKLASFRIKDRVNMRDLIDVELIDQCWVARLPPELGARLQHLLDTPEG